MAFIFAVTLTALRRRLLHRERLLESTPSKHRAKLVETFLDRVSVDTDNLTRDQRYQLALHLIRRRSERFRLLVIFSVIVIAVGGGLAAYALSLGQPADRVYRVRVLAIGPDEKPVEGTRIWSVPSGELKQISGGWEIVIPESGLPKDRRLEVHATKEEEFLQGRSELILGDDRSPVVRLQLLRPEVEVRGIVEDSSGRAVEGARIRVVGWPESVTTGPDGTFVLPGHAADGEEVRLRAEKGTQVADEWVLAGDHPVTLILEEP